MYTYIYRERERDISLSLWIPEIVLTDTLSAGASCGDPATELPSTSIVLVLVLVLCVYIYIYIYIHIYRAAPEPGPRWRFTSFRTGSGQMGFSQKGHDSPLTSFLGKMWTTCGNICQNVANCGNTRALETRYCKM